MNDNHIATVGELIAALSDYDPATPVRIATESAEYMDDPIGHGVRTPGGPDSARVARTIAAALQVPVEQVPRVSAWAAALVDATTASVLIAVVDDSDTALLLSESPGGHRWITVLGAPGDSAGRAAVAGSRAMTAIAEVAVAWPPRPDRPSPPNLYWRRCARPTATTGPPIRRSAMRRETSRR